MKTKAQDFTIFWDNAYAFHHLEEKPARVKNILETCKHAGNPDRVLMWSSTSKMTFASAGLAMMAGSGANIQRTKKQMSYQTIGPDKLNQLRHVMFFKNSSAVDEHMKKHAAILKPKFDAVQHALETELGGKNIATWSTPGGGYFVSLDTMAGCAAAVVKLAAEAGLKLTPAGSTFPYMRDPLDRNIRLAPSFPPLEDIQTAMELVGICVELVSIDKLLGQ
jgi:DNA-binding transcriptional MocR family regulator